MHRVALEAGDVLLLCSDGLTNMLSNERIQAVLDGAPDPEQACAELIRLANEQGGTDNLTVVAARYA